MGEQAGAGFQKEKAKRKPVGGVAQLGEHLPCKQGVKSSNLSISTWSLKEFLSKAVRGRYVP